jgi:hypothetical protein
MEKGDVRMYDEKKRNGRGQERKGEILCILGRLGRSENERKGP